MGKIRSACLGLGLGFWIAIGFASPPLVAQTGFSSQAWFAFGRAMLANDGAYIAAIPVADLRYLAQALRERNPAALALAQHPCLLPAGRLALDLPIEPSQPSSPAGPDCAAWRAWGRALAYQDVDYLPDSATQPQLYSVGRALLSQDPRWLLALDWQPGHLPYSTADIRFWGLYLIHRQAQWLDSLGHPDLRAAGRALHSGQLQQAQGRIANPDILYLLNALHHRDASHLANILHDDWFYLGQALLHPSSAGAQTVASQIGDPRLRSMAQAVLARNVALLPQP